MYHVKRADGEERSMYADSLAGMEAAVNEAIFRTKHTGQDHVVYDDVQGKIVHTINCDRREYEAHLIAQQIVPHKPKKDSGLIEWCLILILCTLLVLRMWGHG